MTINFGQHGAKKFTKKYNGEVCCFRLRVTDFLFYNSEHLVSSRVVACLTSGTFYREII